MVKNFCCGLLPLRTGCLVITIVGLILALSTWAYNLGSSAVYRREYRDLSTGRVQSGYWGGWYAFILALILEILVWVALFLGLNPNKNKHQLVLGSLIGLLIAIILRVILFSVMMADDYLKFYYNNEDVGFLILNLLFFLASVGLYIYFGIVMISYYQTVKGGSGIV